MTKPTSQCLEPTLPLQGSLPLDYFRLRDFEYAQPLYDLAFLIEVHALAAGKEVPKFRTFSLWRAGYSLDGYGTTIDRWLEGSIANEDLDHVPSARIRQYLSDIRLNGTIPELGAYQTEQYNLFLDYAVMGDRLPHKLGGCAHWREC